jgi:hypothetical protein
MSNISYNFLNSYENLSVVSVPLCVVNYTLQNIVTCFCGDIDTVFCYPDFTNLPQQLSFIENWGYYIDMGDGTILSGLTAAHNYKVPGTYNITLVVSSSSTNFYKSTNVVKIEAYNIIPDYITLTYLSGNNILSSSIQNEILVTRYNSFQTYQSLSADGYTINLSVSGNRSKLQIPSTYESDQNSHLKLFSAFTETTAFAPITYLKTTTDKIFAQINPLTNNIQILSNESAGTRGVPTFFVGTSGTGRFRYYEDYTK